LTLFSGEGIACRRGERLVFRGLSFASEPGAALLLTGRNGSGKSSLLRLMAGLSPPEAGKLRWAGLAIEEDAAAHRRRLHFIGHQDALKPVLTVAETAAFWAAMKGGSDSGAAAALERFRLGALAGQPCRFLSAGQKKRLSLSRLLASPAPLWLLDEPTTGLDTDSVADLEAIIAAHRGAGGIVVASTHIPLRLDGALTCCLGDYAAPYDAWENEEDEACHAE
jgi:heme exporter protein A